MKRNPMSLAISIVLGMACSVSVHAQSATDDSSTDEAKTDKVTRLEGITVTARKRTETLMDVPVAVTAFTPESVDTLNIEDLSDLGSQVPNLTIYAARGSSSTITAYIRGVGQSDPLWGVDPGVGIYLDDVYIARPQGALLDVFDVERIEVLRGPQGTLYGKNTIGGAIKYISKPLSPNFNGYGQITVGNYSELDAKAAVGGAFDKDGMFRARISVASMNRDGFGKNIVTRQQVSDKEVNAARISFGIFPNDAFNIVFNYDWMDDQSGVRGAKMLAPNRFVPTAPPLDSRYDVRNGMPNINDTSMDGISATASWRINDDWNMKYILAYRSSDTETNIDFDTTQAPIADVKAFYSDSQTTNELQFNYDAGGRSRGVFGIYSFDGDAGGQVLNNFFGLLFGDTQGTVYTDSIALYGDWTFDLTDRLKLDAGIRYTDEDKRADVLNRGYSDGTYTTPTAVVADFDKTINFKNTSPKLSLDYQISPEAMVYGSFSRGFKSGGYNIRAQATAVPRSAEPFKDEKVDTFEVGGKFSLLDDSLFLNLAVFHNKYEDIQLSVFTAFDSDGDGIDDAFFGDFTNAGKGTAQGVEFEYQWLLSQNWLISGNLAYLKTKYDEFNYAGVNIANQQEFTNAPKQSGAINIEYNTPIGDGGNLAFRLGYNYQSEVVATTEITSIADPITQGGYGLINAGVIWRTNDNWMFSLQGTNLADREYRTTGYNINSALGVLTGFYGPPRQYTLTARYSF
ncbi:MAG TPA: TonB-dependent receptor [Dokdonella sp.]|uniref:TonB-dependent receptor n=1 Tax=Dokdonella sp. TaxID=2291710 RepID=UPI002D7F8223|nr:TonB-dependent receptor [Dokdonella sp.]HET9032571.1 TonB-dependent receptor [Dokdonella sp.]